jgi:hypothetical protein
VQYLQKFHYKRIYNLQLRLAIITIVRKCLITICKGLTASSVSFSNFYIENGILSMINVTTYSVSFYEFSQNLSFYSVRV